MSGRRGCARVLSPLAFGVLAALAALGVPSAHLAAQGVTTAEVAGRVADARGDPLEGVRVEVVHQGTGAVATAVTDAAGRFSVAHLRPGGPYEVTARRIGFGEARRVGLVLTVGRTATLSLTLSESPVALPGLEVQVSVDPTFDPSRIGAATLVDPQTVERVPTLTRDVVDLAALSPLARQDEDAGGFSVAGQNLRYNNVQLDGALSQDVFGLSPTGVAGGRAGGRPVPLEAIEQFQLLVAPYDVRQSGFTGGVLNAVTRGGTNRWEGTAFGFWRDEALVGDLSVDGVSRGPETFDNLHGGLAVGGPLARDRAHLFLAAELERIRRPPDGFNLGSVDPLRVRLSPDSAARAVQLLSALGAEPGTFGTFTLENRLANVFLRFDVQPSERHRLMLRHNFAGATDQPAPNRLPGDAYGLSSAGTDVESRTHSTVAQLFSELGRGVSNELFINLQFLRETESPVADFPRVDLEVASRFEAAELTRTVRAGAPLFAHANELDQDILQVADNLTLRLGGGHRLLAGASLERFGIRRLFLPGSLGSYRFDGLEALAANRPARYDITLPLDPEADPASAFDVLQWAAYLQDEWRLSDRLNLRLGLRADVPVIPDVPARNPAVEQTFGLRTDRMPSGRLLLSPRAGFNLRLGEAGGTQVRGGAGLFTGRPPFVWLFNAFRNTGLETVSLTCREENAPPLDPGGPAPRVCMDGTGPETAGRPTINAFDPDFRFPQDLKLSLAVDRRLPAGFVGSLEALYSRAVNQVFLEDLNVGEPVADPRHEDGYSDGFGFRGGGREAFGTPTVSGFDPGRRSDDFAQVIHVTNRSDNVAYALSAELRRDLGERWGVRLGYAFTRSSDTQSLIADDVTTNFGLTPAVGDPNDPSRQASLFDRPHKAVAHVWGRLPALLDGTELGVLYTGQSGRPYTYVYASDVNGDGYPGEGRAQDLANDPLFVPDSPFGFPARGIGGVLMEQLVLQQPCLARNRGAVLNRNACRLPWIHRLDVRLAQGIRVGQGSVQVLLDLLNVLNLLDSAWGRVETAEPLVRLADLAGRDNDLGATPEDPLLVRYLGPVASDPETGSVRAVVPTAPAVPASQWQARLGVRLRFR